MRFLIQVFFYEKSKGQGDELVLDSNSAQLVFFVFITQRVEYSFTTDNQRRIFYGQHCARGFQVPNLWNMEVDTHVVG